MTQTKRMRMAKEELSKDFNETDSRKNQWGNLPYPAIRTIAKFDLQCRYTVYHKYLLELPFLQIRQSTWKMIRIMVFE